MLIVSFLEMSVARELLKQITSHPQGVYSFSVTVEVIDRAMQRRQLPKSVLKFSLMPIQLFLNSFKENIFNPLIINKWEFKKVSLKLLESAVLHEVCRNNRHSCDNSQNNASCSCFNNKYLWLLIFSVRLYDFLLMLLYWPLQALEVWSIVYHSDCCDPACS